MTPASYPGHLARQRVLPDGRPVLIRPILPEDEQHERRFLARLSADTRRKRFKQWAGSRDGELAHFHTDLDYDKHMALVCAARDEQGDRLVGEACYLANPDRRSCEFAIVVADDWQHTGVAQLLMRDLMHAAAERGIQTMASLVLASNTGMLDFSRELGFALEPVAEDPRLVRITKTLGSGLEMTHPPPREG